MVPNDGEGEATGPENQAVEEREAEFARIAEQLAALSAAEEYPAGFAAAGEPFESEDVQFQSDGWLLRVLDVQTWLHLDESVDRARATSDPAAAALELFKMLGADPVACVESTDGVTRPSRAGAALLSRRLDSAVRLKLAFEELRESLSRRQATDRWDEMWDEEPSGTAVLEPVKATADVWPIQEFTDKAIKNRLNLSPTYQRGDVWSTDLYQQLIISILRGIPLPSIILLRPHSRGSSGKYEVVDGKQRLTAILRFTGKYPDALQRVKSQEARARHCAGASLRNELQEVQAALEDALRGVAHRDQGGRVLLPVPTSTGRSRSDRAAGTVEWQVLLRDHGCPGAHRSA